MESSSPARKRLIGPLDGFDLVLLALMVVTFLAVALLPFAAKKFGDGDHHIEGQAIAAFVRGAGNWNEIALAKAPAPSLFYAIPYLLVPPGAPDDVFWRFGFAWTTLWMGFALLLIRRAAETLSDKTTGPKAGKVAGLLVLASPFSVYYSYGIAAEVPAYIGVTLFVYGWARWQDAASSAFVKRRMARVALVGLTFFLLSRPNGALLIPIAAVMAVVLWRRGPTTRASALFAGRCALWGSVALLGMIAVGRALPGRKGVERQTEHLGQIVLQGSFQFREEPFDWRFWGPNYRVGSRDYDSYRALQDTLYFESVRTGVSTAKLTDDWIIADLRSHPLLALRAAAMRVVYGQVTLVNSVPKDSFRMGPLRGRFGYYLLHAFINIANLLLLGASLWGMYMRRETLAVLWPLWGTFIALLVFHAFVYMEPRYLFPVRAIIAVLGASALVRIRGTATASTASDP